MEQFEWVKPRGAQVLIRSVVTLVSPGTERAMFCGLPNTRTDYPAYPGYSGAGVVVAVGSKRSRFKVGERAAGPLPHASLALADEERVFAIPDGVSFEGAAFVQLAIIALQGVRKVQPLLGRSVAVLGQGLVGQLAIQFAYLSGAYPVIAVGCSPQKLALSKQSGATEIIALGEDPEAPDRLAVEVAIEASGNPAAVVEALRCVRPRGQVVLLGSSRGVSEGVDFGRLVLGKGVQVIGAHSNALPQLESSPGWWTWRREGETFFSLLAHGDLHLDHLVSERVNPIEAGWFYRRLARCERGIVGAFFDWVQLNDGDRMRSRFFLAPPQELVIRERLFLEQPDPRPGDCWQPLD
jgi:threonine dehydrogenase-like Zn-dependent dehydrogenase